MFKIIPFEFGGEKRQRYRVDLVIGHKGQHDHVKNRIDQDQGHDYKDHISNDLISFRFSHAYCSSP